MTADSTYEYELIDISFEQPYELPEEESQMVHEWEPAEEQPAESEIEYDSEGIPMGGSQAEIQERRNVIHEYIQSWRAEHVESPSVYNINLNEYIRVNHVFLLESVSHAAIKYQSTKAVLRMAEIMKNAVQVGITNKKEGNSNQKPFEKMIVMRYQSKDLGNVKMTVGVRNRTHEKIEYSITVPASGEPFITDAMKKKTKNTRRKKRSR